MYSAQCTMYAVQCIPVLYVVVVPGTGGGEQVGGGTSSST